MAKQRKTKKQKITKISTDLVSSKIQPIDYMGEVTLKLNHGNKTIQTKKYTNKGMPNLFKFLCTALMGNYTENLKPCQVKLFTYSEANEVKPNEGFDWTTKYDSGVLKSASAFVTYSSSPTLTKNKDTGAYQVTYHFRIPFMLISNHLVHAIGLFPKVVINEGEDICAYYLLTKMVEKDCLWDPLELDDIAGNFSIILDWTLTIMNKSSN